MLQTLTKLLAFFDFAQFLDGIGCLSFLARRGEYLGSDEMKAGDSLVELIVAPIGCNEVFLMSFHLLVAVLNHLLVSQESLFVLLDDVLGIALE